MDQFSTKSMEYTLKRKYEQIDKEIETHIDELVLYDIKIKEANLEIFKIQQKIKKLRIKIETSEKLIINKRQILEESGWNATNVE